MKTLIIFYSHTGNTMKVAEILRDKLGADIEAIKDKVDRRGPIGYLRSGREATLKLIPEILTLQSQLSDYDLVIIGTPVWAFTMASPVRAFLKKYSAQIKKAAFFCTQGSSGAERTFEQMAELLGQTPLVEMILYTKEVRLNQISQKLEKFIEQIKNI